MPIGGFLRRRREIPKSRSQIFRGMFFREMDRSVRKKGNAAVCCRFVPRKRFPWISWSWRKRKECLRRGATRRECSPGVLVVASSSCFSPSPLISLSLLHFEIYVHLGRPPPPPRSSPFLLPPLSFLTCFFHVLLFPAPFSFSLFLSFSFALAGETNRTFRSSFLFFPFHVYLVPSSLLLARISFLPPGRTAAGSSLLSKEKG